MIGSTFAVNIASAVFLFMLATGYSTVCLSGAWRMFVKGGRRGWESLIPVWNVMAAYIIAYGSCWRILWFVIPPAGIVSLFRLDMKLAAKYGRNPSFGLGLFFLNPVFICLLGFTDPSGDAWE